MRTDEEVQAILSRGFRYDELEWKIQTSGVSPNTTSPGNPEGVWARVVPYITSRAIIERLIEAFGPAGFNVGLHETMLGNVNGMRASIEAVWPSGKITVREDVAEMSDIEALKGAASGAIKRAAVQYQIGSYLYTSPDFYAAIGPDGPNKGFHKGKNGGKDVRYKWHLPKEATDWVSETSWGAIGSTTAPVPAVGQASAAAAPSPSNAPSSSPTGSPPPSPPATTAARTTPSSSSVLMPGKPTWFKGMAGQPIDLVESAILREAAEWYGKRIAEKPDDRWILRTKGDLAIIEAEIERRGQNQGDDGPPPPEENPFEGEGDDDLPF